MEHYELRNADRRPRIEQGAQLLQERIGLYAVACLKALFESITNRREQLERRSDAMLIPPQSREAARGSQFP